MDTFTIHMMDTFSILYILHAHQACKNQLLKDLTTWIAKQMENHSFCRDSENYHPPQPIKLK